MSKNVGLTTYPALRIAVPEFMVGYNYSDSLLRPSAVGHVAERHRRGVELHVLDLFALPGVGDVRLAVGRADDGRIGKLPTFCLQIDGRLPVAAIGRDSDRKRAAAA